MSKQSSMVTNTSGEVRQYSLAMILWMFAWPAVWYTVLIYLFARPLIPAGGTTQTWLRLSITALGPAAELIAGAVLLRREGYSLTLHGLQDRIRWRWPTTRKAWLVAGAILVLGLALSMAAGPLNKAMASVPRFAPPEWWGAAGNPTVKIQGPADAFPDITLEGNFLFILLYLVIGLVFNILGEELYYRGFLLPKMRAVFGASDWVANGVLFALKHVYQRWLYPGLLVAGLSFAFAAGPLGSLPLAMLYHWVGNFLLNLIFLVLAAAGLG